MVLFVYSDNGAKIKMARFFNSFVYLGETLAFGTQLSFGLWD